jgi:hypothetical protein
MTAFADLQKCRVVLDACTIADWAAVRLARKESRIEDCQQRWRASERCCEHLVKAQCRFPSTDRLIGEVLAAMRTRMSRVPRDQILNLQEEFEQVTTSELQGTLAKDLERALKQQIKNGRIEKKDEHVVRLALKRSARGILTADHGLASGVQGHRTIAGKTAAWHVLDADAELSTQP